MWKKLSTQVITASGKVARSGAIDAPNLVFANIIMAWCVAIGRTPREIGPRHLIGFYVNHGARKADSYKVSLLV